MSFLSEAEKALGRGNLSGVTSAVRLLIETAKNAKACRISIANTVENLLHTGRILIAGHKALSLRIHILEQHKESQDDLSGSVQPLQRQGDASAGHEVEEQSG